MDAVAKHDREYLLENYGVDTKLQDFTPAKIAATLTALKGLLPVVKKFDLPYTKHFLNGILDGATGKLLENKDGQYFVSPPCNVEWDPNAESDWVDKVLKTSLPDLEQRQLLGEFQGVQMFGDNRPEKILVMLGIPGGGKGLANTGLKNVVGEDNIIGLKPEDLTSSFGQQKLIGKTVCQLNEAETFNKEATEFLKRVSGRDALQIDVKNKTQFNGVLNVVFTIVCNHLSTFVDPSGAMNRRLLVVHFKEEIQEQVKADLFKDKVEEPEHLKAWMRFAYDGYQRFLNNGRKFTPNPHGEKLKATINKNTSPLPEFLKEWCEFGADLEVAKTDLHKAYLKFLEKKNIDARPRAQKFTSALQIHAGEIEEYRETTKSRRYMWKGIRVKENELKEGN